MSLQRCARLRRACLCLTTTGLLAALLSPGTPFCAGFLRPVRQTPPSPRLRLAAGASASGSPPDWEALEQLLASASTEEELQSAEVTKAGKGPLRADRSEVRLFDAAGSSDVRVTLYRDHASWCPYCEKVQLALEEKQVPYAISKVNMNCYGDKPFEFLLKNPMGLLPVAEVDGDLITESDSILNTIESRFPNPLIPPGREGEVRTLLRLERQLFGSWFTWLRSSGNDEGNQRRFEEDLSLVESRLQANGGPFFLGSRFSVVECHFASFLERMAASLAYFKGFQMRRNAAYPHVEAWFEAMESRDSYRALAGDFYTHAHDLPPQVGGCAENGKNEAYRRAIDGEGEGEKAAEGWRLPLPEGSPTELEPLLKNDAEESQAARREAARKLLGNREAVRRFCLRGKGSPGFPPVGAQPLADPRAQPSEDKALATAVDEALRSVASQLLSGDGQPLQSEAVGPGALERPEDVAACLVYLRDRVGVPRDLSFPAARQLRAHLNSFIEATEMATAS